MNIARYNFLVEKWNKISKNHTIYVRNYLPDHPDQPSILQKLNIDDSQHDKIPNTKPSDNFTQYKQIKWYGNVFFFKDLPFKSEEYGKMFVTIHDNILNKNQTTEMTFLITFKSKYCCSSDSNNICNIYCHKYKRIESICILVDLQNLIALEKGCKGGFGSKDLEYYTQDYISDSSVNNSATVDFYIRDVNDPYYNIPFIIGFGIGNTWGVDKQDRIIVFSIFYIISGFFLLMNMIVLFWRIIPYFF